MALDSSIDIHEQQVKTFVEGRVDNLFEDTLLAIVFSKGFLENHGFEKFKTKKDYFLAYSQVLSAFNTLSEIDAHIKKDRLLNKLVDEITYYIDVQNWVLKRTKKSSNSVKVINDMCLDDENALHELINISKFDSDSIEDVTEFVKDYIIEYSQLAIEKRSNYYLTSIKDIINNKVFHLDKVLALRAKKSKGIVSHFKSLGPAYKDDNKISGNPFLIKYLK